MNHNVALAEQIEEPRAGLRFAQIETRGPLAEHHFRDDAGLVPIGRVDAQHIGAIAGQKARRDGAGKHPRQIEHLDARQRPRRFARIGERRRGLGLPNGNQRLAIDAAALGMGGPFLDRLRIFAAQPPLATTASSSSRPASARPPARRSPCRARRRAQPAPPPGDGARWCAGGSIRRRLDNRRRSDPKAAAAPSPAGRSELENQKEARRRSTRTCGAGAAIGPTNSETARPAAAMEAAARSVTAKTEGRRPAPISARRDLALRAPPPAARQISLSIAANGEEPPLPRDRRSRHRVLASRNS